MSVSVENAKHSTVELACQAKKWRTRPLTYGSCAKGVVKVTFCSRDASIQGNELNNIPSYMWAAQIAPCLPENVRKPAS